MPEDSLELQLDVETSGASSPQSAAESARCADDEAPPIALDLRDASRMFLVMAQACVEPDREAQAPLRRGSSHWRARGPSGEAVTLSFDWQEVRTGVLCLADPMQIRSNLRLLRDGVPVGDAAQRVLLANCVYRLNWQGAVVELLNLTQPPANA